MGDDGDDLATARALLPGLRLAAVSDLGGGDRSAVRRVRAHRPDGGDTLLVVKSFHQAGEGWAREAAALSTAPAAAPVPRLIAEHRSPPTVVLADLGDGGSVADALLGGDAGAAAGAVQLWAHTLGLLHRATVGRRGPFRAALAERAGELPIIDSLVSSMLDEAARLLGERCAALGVELPAGALGELHELGRRLGPDGPAALSPSDACPDNNVRVGDGLVLLDFEGAQWRHVAWDVAYLGVPWPSCWCSWRMPAEVADRALERYRAAVEDVLPYVREPRFREDVADAAAGWELLTTAWYLPGALGADRPPDRGPTPTRRAMILHRLDGARRNPRLTAMAELAARLRGRLVEAWGEVPLAFAPAFDESA